MNDDTKKRLGRWLRDGMIVLALGVTFVFGLWVGAPDAAEEAATDTATTWTCSMHPQIRLPEPGACPICGMDLIPQRRAPARRDRDLRSRQDPGPHPRRPGHPRRHRE